MAAPPDPIIARRRDIYASIYGLAGVIAFLADRLHHQELGELARATMDAATVSLVSNGSHWPTVADEDPEAARRESREEGHGPCVVIVRLYGSIRQRW
jgi:hypothetical protein